MAFNRVLSLILLCSFFVFSTQAAVIEGLFNASVEIENQSPAQQKKGASAALAEVLVKVSGTKAILSDADIKRAMRNADNLLTSYQFDIQQDVVLYDAQFNANKIEQLIRSTGYPIWGKHRPETLIWLAIEEQPTRSRSLLSDSALSELTEAAREQAQLRGIKISFPVLDLTDLQQVSVYDVWSNFMQNIVDASGRYGTEYTLTSRVYFRTQATSIVVDEQVSPIAPEPLNVWVAEWTTARQGTFHSGEVSGSSQSEAIERMIDAVADVLGETYAISAVTDGSADDAYRIQIDNISSLTRYAEVMAFLKSLSMVIDVSLVAQQGQMATFELKLFGAKENLEQAFGLDERLKRPLDSFGQPIADMPYLWRP